MSILSAMNTAVSGLDAESIELGNISNNISGSSTVGYKEAETDFETLVLAAGGPSTGPQLCGVSAKTALDVATAGQLETTGVSTDVAINGSGFMVVNTDANSANGGYLLTQAGSFRPDAQGNLVNAAGYYLQGQPLNAAGGILNASGTGSGTPATTVNGLSTVNISNISVASTPTTSVNFAANLPSSDTATAAAAAAASGTNAPSTSVTYYDQLGTPQTLTFTFTPTPPATPTSAPTNQWTMNVADSGSPAAANTIATATLNFDSNGLLMATSASTVPSSTAYDPTTGILSVTTGDGQNIGINVGSTGSTAGISQLDGSYQTTKIQTDGSSFGLMQSVSIGTDGIVTAAFSNGATRPIYQIDVAIVPNPDGLAPVSGDAYSLTPAAGVAQLYAAGTGPAGTTVGGSLEGSNVDLSTELTNLIATQRAYSSSATVIQTANAMLGTLTTLNQ